MPDPLFIRLLTIGIGLAIGGLGLVLRKKTGTWTHPGVVFALFWCLMTLVPILGVPEIAASPSAMTYLFAATLAFGMPAFFIDWRPAIAAAAARRGHVDPVFASRNLLYLFLAVQILPVIFVAVNLQLHGFPLSALITDPLATGCSYLNARYSGEIQGNFFSQAGTVLNYVGVALGGLVIASRHGIWRRLFVVTLSFLPSILYLFIYADKGTLFLSIAYLYGAVIVARIASGDTALITKTTVLALAAAVCIIIPIVILAMLNRADGDCGNQRTTQILDIIGSLRGNHIPDAHRTYSDLNRPDLGTNAGIIYNIRSYAFGHLFSFSDWFEHDVFGVSSIPYRDPKFLTWGFWTFMATGKYLSPHYFATIPSGYYDEYFRSNGILQTNIYTLYRGLIYDFTIPGSLLFMGFFGWISSTFYGRMLQYMRTPIAHAYYIFLAGFIYSSYLISLLIWSSAYAAGVAVLILLMVLEQKRSRGARRVEFG